MGLLTVPHSEKSESPQTTNFCEKNCENYAEVLDLLTKGCPMEQILSSLIHEIEQRSEQMRCSVLLLDVEKRKFTKCVAPSMPPVFHDFVKQGIDIEPNLGSCASAAWHGKRIIACNTLEDPKWKNLDTLINSCNIKASWAEPIFYGHKNNLIGVFAMYYTEPKSPSRSDEMLIEKAAAIAGIAISQSKIKEALKYRYGFERIIFSTSNRFISTTGDKIEYEIQKALKELGEFTESDKSFVGFFSQDKNTFLTWNEWTDKEAPTPQKNKDETHPHKLPWMMNKIKSGEMIFAKYPTDLPHNATAEKELLIKNNVLSLVALPLTYRGESIGVIGLQTTIQPKEWSSDDISLLEMFGQIISNAYSRKQVEEELMISKEQYLQNQAQLSLAFDSTHIGMATCTIKGRFLSVNNALCKMLGRTAEDLLKTSFSAITFPDDARIHRKKIIDLFRKREKIIEIEKRYIHADGSIIYAHKRLGAVYDSAGKPLYLVAEIIDITEKKRWEEEYFKASKLEALGILAGGIAHDFNNILMGVLGAVSHTKHELEANTKIKNRLNEVEKAVHRAKDLTHQLLTFSKGGAPIKKSASIPEIFKDVTDFTLSGSNVSAHLLFPEDLWSAHVDYGQISQVINNLIINAVQAMSRGGEIRVYGENVTIYPDNMLYNKILIPGKYLKFTISDTGGGIAPENLQKIFDPFFTTKENGNGLGLATSYSIIKKHQGHIEVNSQLNLGSTFTIFLPADATSVAKEEEVSEKHIHKGCGKILIMDDEPMVREIARDMIIGLGYSAEVAKNGLETIRLYEQAKNKGEPYDLVIMDLTIPGGIGGEATLQYLKKIDPKVKAVVSSGYSEEIKIADFEKHGFKAVMPKPYDLYTLSNIIFEVINS